MGCKNCLSYSVWRSNARKRVFELCRVYYVGHQNNDLMILQRKKPEAQSWKQFAQGHRRVGHTPDTNLYHLLYCGPIGLNHQMHIFMVPGRPEGICIFRPQT